MYVHIFRGLYGGISKGAAPTRAAIRPGGRRAKGTSALNQGVAGVTFSTASKGAPSRTNARRKSPISGVFSRYASPCVRRRTTSSRDAAPGSTPPARRLAGEPDVQSGPRLQAKLLSHQRRFFVLSLQALRFARGLPPLLCESRCVGGFFLLSNLRRFVVLL